MEASSIVTWDLVKTIDSDDVNVPMYDSSSESEEEFQPKQLKNYDPAKKKKGKEFSQEFEFGGRVVGNTAAMIQTCFSTSETDSGINNEGTTS
jgi:hypothetical protein